VYINDIKVDTIQPPCFKNYTFVLPKVNVTLRFLDIDTREELTGVTIKYRIYGEGHEIVNTTTVDSGYVLQVPKGWSIEIDNATKTGYVSDLELLGMCVVRLFLQNDTEIVINFAKNTSNTVPQGLSSVTLLFKITLLFKNYETNELLWTDVYLYAKIYYNGLLWDVVNKTVPTMYTFVVPNGSQIVIIQADAKGYESELRKLGYCLVINVNQSNINEVVWFYPVEQKATLRFTFFDGKTGALIPGVHLKVYEDGKLIIDEDVDYYKDYQVERGHLYTYTATKQGYFSYSDSIYVGEDYNNYDIDVYLTPIPASTGNNTTTITFVVQGEEGGVKYPLGGALVTLNGVSKVTSSTGRVEFEVPVNSNYTYVVSCNGYYSIQGTVNVSESPKIVYITLPKKPSEDYIGQPEPIPPSSSFPSYPSDSYPSSGTNPTYNLPYSSSEGTNPPIYQTITSGYTPPNPELREAAKQTLSNWYSQIPSFFSLIFLLFFMATLTRVFPRRRR